MLTLTDQLHDYNVLILRALAAPKRITIIGSEIVGLETLIAERDRVMVALGLRDEPDVIEAEAA